MGPGHLTHESAVKSQSTKHHYWSCSFEVSTFTGLESWLLKLRWLSFPPCCVSYRSSSQISYMVLIQGTEAHKATWGQGAKLAYHHFCYILSNKVSHRNSLKGQKIRLHLLIVDAMKSHCKGRQTLGRENYWSYYCNQITTILFGVIKESSYLVIPDIVEDIDQWISCRITNIG